MANTASQTLLSKLGPRSRKFLQQKPPSCSKARRKLKLKSQMPRPKRRRLRPQRPMIVLRRKVASVKLKEGSLFKTVALFNSVSLMRLR